MCMPFFKGGLHMINMVVYGLGKISRRVCNGCLGAKNMNLYGFVSRDFNKATTYKEEYYAKKAYASIKDVYEDENVDVIYLCTPNYLHYEQIKEALENKKSVICEKPMVLESFQLDKLFELAKRNKVFLMEAHKTAFNPLLVKVKEMIQEGAIGDIYYIDAEYSHNILNDDPNFEQWVFGQSGGASRDIGVYPACFSNYFAQSDIVSHYIVKSGYKDLPCDFFFQSLLEYENGIKASIKSSWLYDKDHKGTGYIYGTKGYFKIPAYWKEKEAFLIQGDKATKIMVDFYSDFTSEIEHAAKCIESNCIESNIMSLHASKEILKAIGQH